MKMSVKKLKAYKETIIEKIDKVIAIKEKKNKKEPVNHFKGLSGSSKGIIKW